MSLTEYRDDAIEQEVGARFGAYRTSFAFGEGIVEIHVFQAAAGELVAFITKSPGFPMAVAHRLAEEALSLAGGGAGTTGRVVLDPDSFGRSGSL